MEDSTETCVGIIAVTPEGASRAYRELSLGYYDHFGRYVNPVINMITQPLIDHVNTFGDKSAWLKMIQDCLDKLESIGSNLIMMPANSSHLIYHGLTPKKSTILNMVDESICYLKSISAKKSLLIGTSVSLSESLYLKDTYIRDHMITMSQSEQDSIDDIIKNELILGRISKSSKRFIEEMVETYRKKELIDRVFFACTELPCFFNDNISGVEADNSLSILVSSVIDKTIINR